MLEKYLRYYPKRYYDSKKNEAIKSFKTNNLYQYEVCNCVNCESENKITLFNNDRYNIQQRTVMCSNCGLVYSSPRLNVESANRFYENGDYRKIYGDQDPEHWFRITENINPSKVSNVEFDRYDATQYYNFIINNTDNIKSICEIGAGAGWNMVPFEKSGHEIIGFEPDSQLVEFGRGKGLNLQKGFIDTISGEYDLIMMKHVLEHLHQPVGALRRLRKNVGKYLYIEVPGFETKLPSIQNAHLYYFSKATLQSILSKAGYECIHIDFYRDNNFIFSIFEKSETCKIYSYNYKSLIEQKKNIYNKYNAKKIIKIFKRKLYK